MSKVTVACVGSVLAVHGVVDVFILAAVAASGGSVFAVRLLFVGAAGWRVLLLFGGAAQGEAAELLEGEVEVSGGVGLAAWSANE